jgi:hypothetical protein
LLELLGARNDSSESNSGEVAIDLDWNSLNLRTHNWSALVGYESASRARVPDFRVATSGHYQAMYF